MKSFLFVTAEIIVLSLLFVSLGFSQGVIWVDDDAQNDPGRGTFSNPYLKIQDAIDSVTSGTTRIYVRAGTYNEDISIDDTGLSRTILLIGSGVSGCTISGTGNTSVVTLINNDSDTVISDFLITNGIGTGTGTHKLGGGIYLKDSSAVITDNKIYDNEAIYGGAIYCKNNSELGTLDCRPYIEDNEICYNTCETSNDETVVKGGGIYCENIRHQMKIEDNYIHHNYAIDGTSSGTCYGGGIYLGGGVGVLWSGSNSITIKNNRIESNEADTIGGGVYTELKGNFQIISNRFLGNNEAALSLGAKNSQTYYDEVELNTFISNTNNDNSGAGGAIHVGSYGARLTNNVYMYNESNNCAGAIFVEATACTLTSETVIFNSALGTNGNAGGVYVNQTACTMINTIIWDNYATNGLQEWDRVSSPTPVPVTITFSNINDPANPNDPFPHLNDTNLYEDPIFIDEDDEYHLANTNSPMIDVGDHTAAALYLLTVDIDGENRIITVTVYETDMGADEYNP